jgi:hypothetical protein
VEADIGEVTTVEEAAGGVALPRGFTTASAWRQRPT